MKNKFYILKKKNLTKQEFINISNNSVSISEVMRKTSLSFNSIKRLQKLLNCETKNITKWKGKNFPLDVKSVLEGKTTFKKISYYSNKNKIVKKYLFENNLKEEKCEDCDLYEWRGKKLPLELEHMDGDSNNYLFENLKILCPNCHSITSTYKGKNKGKKG